MYNFLRIFDVLNNGALEQYGKHHIDLFGRGGNFLTYVIILSEEETTSLSVVMQANPSLVHKLTHVMMTGHFGVSEEEWAKVSPDYEAWRKIDDGELKIAFRKILTDMDPTIVSF